MDDVYTHCRSRGADGVAFVVQGEGPTALGRSGMVRKRDRQRERETGKHKHSDKYEVFMLGRLDAGKGLEIACGVVI